MVIENELQLYGVYGQMIVLELRGTPEHRTICMVALLLEDFVFVACASFLLPLLIMTFRFCCIFKKKTCITI